MAVTSGRVESNKYSKSFFYVNWQQDFQDTGGNYTRINWQAGLNAGPSSSSHDNWGNNAVKIKSVYVNGSLVAGESTHSNIKTYGDHQLASGSFDVYHNGDGTKTFNITINGWLYNGHNLSGSADFELNTIPRYFSSSPTLQLTAIDETSATFYWTTSEYCDQVQYKINSGSWVNVSGTGTSGYYTITGLTPNTSYTIYGDYKRSDSQQWSTWGGYTVSVPITTYDYPKPTSTSDFTIGNAVTIAVYNPLRRTYTLELISNNDGSTIGSYNGNINGNVTGFNDNTSVTNQYNSIPNTKQGTYYAKVTYGSSVKTSGNKTYSIDNSDNKCNPTFDTTNWSYTADLTTLTNDDQVVINNQSTVTFSVDTPATAKLGSSIKEYQYKWGTKSNEPNSTDVIRGSGIQLEVTAVDMRGYYTTSPLDLGSNFVNYTQITGTASTHRHNGVEADTTLDISGIFFNDTFGANGVQNIIMSANYYVSTSTDFSQSTAHAINVNSFTFNNNNFALEDYPIHADGVSGGFPVGTRYYVKVELTDKLATTTITNITVTDGKLAFDTYQDSNGDYHVGINGLADPNYTLCVHGKISGVNDVYSPSEVKTNKVWVDSNNVEHTIYRRVVTGNRSGSQTAIDYSTWGVDEITDIHSKLYHENGTWIYFDGYYASADDNWRVFTNINTENIYISCGSTSPAHNGAYKITVEYTKTTD